MLLTEKIASLNILFHDGLCHLHCFLHQRLISFLIRKTVQLKLVEIFFNPLTPMPAVTSRDEPWPFFHFWRHHFWPKLASSMLNVCKRKRSFQWCPDQSDRPNGARDLHKNAQKVERKTQTKICCHHTWLLHGKSCLSRWRFLRSFLTASKPSRRSITGAKETKKRRKRKGEKNFLKNREA